MNKLITRQIKPKIEKANKILICTTPLLLLDLINFGGMVYIKLFLIFGAISVGIYELYIYKQNKEFIGLMIKDKYHLSYVLIMKYFKIGLLIFIFSLPSLSSKFYYDFNFLDIVCVALIVFYLLIEVVIMEKNTLKLFVKYVILFLVLLLIFKYTVYNTFSYYNTISYFSYSTNIKVILDLLIMFQIIYLFISFNLIYLYKDKNIQANYLNYDLIVNLIIIIIYEMIGTAILVNIGHLTIFASVVYFLFLIIILSLGDSLKKHYKTKKTKYSKLAKIYFLCLIFIIPLVFLFNILNIIAIEIINILVLVLYKIKRGIFKDDIVEKASDIYDNWY